MKEVLKNLLVNDQTLATVVAEMSALLNTRPLTYLSVDPTDPDPLTPNHFYTQMQGHILHLSLSILPPPPPQKNNLNIVRKWLNTFGGGG